MSAIQITKELIQQKELEIAQFPFNGSLYIDLVELEHSLEMAYQQEQEKQPKLPTDTPENLIKSMAFVIECLTDGMFTSDAQGVDYIQEITGFTRQEAVEICEFIQLVKNSQVLALIP